MSIFEPYLSKLHHVVPDIGVRPPANSNEFFGYLLISQIETIESVSQLEKKYDNSVSRTDLLEKTVENLKEKCLFLEETISELKKVFIDKTQDKDSASNVNGFANEESLHGNASCLCLAEHVSSTTEPRLITDNKIKDSNFFENDLKELQRLFNKRVKYEVNKKFGPKYLLEHQVRDLDVKEMHKIKRKVIRIFSPFPLSVKAAWNNAMNSLRQDRHQLKKRRNSA